MKLLLFTRKGCCICDTLKSNLSKIDILKIANNLTIEEIDIDRFDLYQNKFRKYDFEVPVLALQYDNSKEYVELPRVSPRIKEINLSNWLKKNINNVFQNL